MSAGKFDAAIPLYEQLVQANPGVVGLVLNLGLAEHMAGREADSIPHFEAVLKTQPTSLPALQSLAGAHMALGHPAQAIAPLQKILAVEPKNTDARGMLAGALAEAKRLDEAAVEYRKLSDQLPDDPRVWFGLGTTYESIAGSAFEKLQKIDAESPYAALLVADTRIQRRQYRSAFFFYQEAAKKLPSLHGVHAAIAEVYKRTGHADWAGTEEAKERAIPDADCKAHPAECLFLGGKTQQLAATPNNATAEALFWQAKAANELALQSFFRLGQLPPSIELHQLRAEMARAQGDHLTSLNEWKEALKLMPGDGRILQEIVSSLFLNKDYKTALEAATDLLKHSPQSPELNFIAGDSQLRLEDAEHAIPYLRAAVRIPAAEASLGLALARTDKAAEAIPHLEKALDLDDDGSLHYQLARAYQAAGKPDKARTTMVQYQEIVKRNEAAKEEVAREAQIAPPQ